MKRKIIRQVQRHNNESTLSWAALYLSKGFSVIPLI